MISGFSNDKVNVNIRYVNMPTSMTDRYNISRDNVNIFRIRFNNIFKNEKIMYATIAILISVFSLITGYTIYYIYDTYKIESHPISIKDGFALDTGISAENTSNLDALLSTEYNAAPEASASGDASGGSSGMQTPLPPSGGSEVASLGVVPREGRKIIEVDENVDMSDIGIGTKQKKVRIALSDSARSNPFVPYTNAVGRVATPSFPEPPDKLIESGEATRVMATSISGILYDKYSPSAIINIQGSDYLVKVGDTINKYKVLGITPTSVTVKLGSNTYSAGVGEQISGQIDYNVISNLSKKFGGAPGIDGENAYYGERL